MLPNADLLFELISRRYQARSTIITTNRAFREWHEVFPNAVSLIDRLVHRCEIVMLQGESYRLKEAMARSVQKGVERAARAARRPPPGYEEKVMNAAFRIGETQLMADDGMGPKQAEFKGMSLVIEAADDAEAKRVFTALGEGGNATMPLAKTFWTSSFGMLTDKFGVPWMVNVESPKA